MTTLAPPLIPRPDAPPFSVWDVYWATIAPLVSLRPEPRPDYAEIAESVTTLIWPETSVKIGLGGRVHPAEVTTLNVTREGDSVSFPGLPGGGWIGGGHTETPGALIPDPKPAPEVVPLPAALPMMLAALVMIVTMKRMTRC